MRVRTDDGVGIEVYEWGGDGPPLLLAHPTGFHGRIWAPVAELLVRSERRVVSLDFRGHGDSDPDPRAEYHWDRFALDALAVARWIDDARLAAAGHSKGAASLLAGAAGDPTIYTRLWCFEPIVFPAPPTPPESGDASMTNPLAASARRRRNAWPSIDEAYESYASRPPLDAMDSRCLRAYVDYGMRDRGDGTFELKCAPETEAAVYSMGPANGVWDRLADIAIPVVVVGGGESTHAASGHLAELTARMPHATLEIWAGHGHFGPQADPERAARSIAAALPT